MFCLHVGVGNLTQTTFASHWSMLNAFVIAALAQQPPLGPAAVDIVPISCFIGHCTFEEDFLALGTSLIILIIGPLIVNSWHDIPLVGGTVLFAALFGEFILGGLQPLFSRDGLQTCAFVFGIATTYAAGIHLLKRLGVWAVRRLAGDRRALLSSLF